MFRGLKILFSCILIALIGVSIYASLEKNLIEGVIAVIHERWALATLFDAYGGFLTFYAWVYYKEPGLLSRIGWLVAILVLGNIAMSFYMLRTISKLPTGSTVGDLLLRKPS